MGVSGNFPFKYVCAEGITEFIPQDKIWSTEAHLPKLGRSAFCLFSWHMGLIWSYAFGEPEYLAFLFLVIRWPGAADT